MKDIIIKCINHWTENHPKLMQWVWFIGLWFLGLIATAILTSPFKILIKIAAASH
jgi:hypothetical protein